jgi:hypothetical protein
MAGDDELTNTKSAMALRHGVTSRSAGRCHWIEFCEITMVMSGPAATTLPRHEHAGDGRGVACIPLYQAFRRMPRRSIVETLLRTLVADISPSRRSCDRVFGFLSTHRCRPEVQATRHSAIGSPACRQPRVDSSARRIEAGSGHPPGFIAQDRRSGSSVLTSCRWSRVPNPAPGLQCPW